MAEMTNWGCVLITGASSGLGEEFAKQLAGRSDQLILVARRAERLEQVRERLLGEYPSLLVRCEVVDVACDEARAALAARLSEAGIFPDVLINNAGLGDYGELITAEREKLQQMMRVNVEALTDFTKFFLPKMTERARGGVIQVSSLASQLPIPDFAVYAATKAYVTSFSEAMRLELREVGVRMTALCPGPVPTEFGQVALRGKGEEKAIGSFYVPKEQVVAEAVQGFLTNRALVFPGRKIRLISHVLNLMPKCLIRALMGRRPRR